MKLSTFNFQFSTLLLAAFLCFQSVSAQTSAISDEARKEIREKIGLDMTVPDFSTKKIDAKVMGPRLAGILEYLLENFHQVIYESYFARILSEQHEALQNKFFNIKKMKLFLKANIKMIKYGMEKESYSLIVNIMSIMIIIVMMMMIRKNQMMKKENI